MSQFSSQHSIYKCLTIFFTLNVWLTVDGCVNGERTNDVQHISQKSRTNVRPFGRRWWWLQKSLCCQIHMGWNLLVVPLLDRPLFEWSYVSLVFEVSFECCTSTFKVLKGSVCSFQHTEVVFLVPRAKLRILRHNSRVHCKRIATDFRWNASRNAENPTNGHTVPEIERRAWWVVSYIKFATLSVNIRFVYTVSFMQCIKVIPFASFHLGYTNTSVPLMLNVNCSCLDYAHDIKLL